MNLRKRVKYNGLFDELCDDTVQNPVIGNLNSDDGMEHKQRSRFRDETNYVEVVGSVAFVKYWQDEQLNSCKACLMCLNRVLDLPKSESRES